MGLIAGQALKTTHSTWHINGGFPRVLICWVGHLEWGKNMPGGPRGNSEIQLAFANSDNRPLIQQTSGPSLTQAPSHVARRSSNPDLCVRRVGAGQGERHRKLLQSPLANFGLQVENLGRPFRHFSRAVMQGAPTLRSGRPGPFLPKR
jgi:hypothetical protein